MKPNEETKVKTDPEDQELSLDELDKASGGIANISNQVTCEFTFEKVNVENLTPAKSARDDWAH